MYELKGPLGTACLCISSLSCEPLLPPIPRFSYFSHFSEWFGNHGAGDDLSVTQVQGQQLYTAKAEAPRSKTSTFARLLTVTQVHRSRGREIFLDVFCKVSSSPVHQPSIYLFLLVCTHDVPDSQDHPTGEGVYFGLQLYEDTVHHEREGRVTRDQLVTLLQRSGTEREEDVGLSYKPTRSTTGNQLKTTCWGV